MPRLVDVVDKIENSGGGAFLDVNNDLGLFIGKNVDCDNMLKMSYAYARRYAVAGMVLQGIQTKKDYDRVYQIFQGYQIATTPRTTREQTVEFQKKASGQAVELIASYTSLFDKETLKFIVGAVESGKAFTPPEGETIDIETLATIVNTARQNMKERFGEDWSNNEEYVKNYLKD